MDLEELIKQADKLKAEGNKTAADKLYREIKKLKREVNGSKDQKSTI